MSLEGRTAIVTGAGRGIGRSIAETLARQGCQLILAARDQASIELAAREISQSCGTPAVAVQTDVTDPASVKNMVDKAVQEFGRVDILVNNAGVTRDNLIMRMSEDDWDTVIQTNLKGAFNCCKAVIRGMLKQRYGRIINITSVSGLAGQAGQANYSASKAGLVGLTKALAREVATRGITVNAVAPGLVPTALTQDMPADAAEAILKATPMGRLGTPEEIAYAVAFFAADEAAYITGQVLCVDGGMTMM